MFKGAVLMHTMCEKFTFLFEKLVLFPVEVWLFPGIIYYSNTANLEVSGILRKVPFFNVSGFQCNTIL